VPPATKKWPPNVRDETCSLSAFKKLSSVWSSSRIKRLTSSRNKVTGVCQCIKSGWMRQVMQRAPSGFLMNAFSRFLRYATTPSTSTTTITTPSTITTTNRCLATQTERATVGINIHDGQTLPALNHLSFVYEALTNHYTSQPQWLVASIRTAFATWIVCVSDLPSADASPSKFHKHSGPNRHQCPIIIQPPWWCTVERQESQVQMPP